MIMDWTQKTEGLQYTTIQLHVFEMEIRTYTDGYTVGDLNNNSGDMVISCRQHHDPSTPLDERARRVVNEIQNHRRADTQLLVRKMNA